MPHVKNCSYNIPQGVNKSSLATQTRLTLESLLITKKTQPNSITSGPHTESESRTYWSQGVCNQTVKVQLSYSSV